MRPSARSRPPAITWKPRPAIGGSDRRVPWIVGVSGASGTPYARAGGAARCGPREMQRELIEGWAFAATETDPRQAERIAAWRVRRLEHLGAGRAHAVVGHYDLAAVIK